MASQVLMCALSQRTTTTWYDAMFNKMWLIHQCGHYRGLFYKILQRGLYAVRLIVGKIWSCVPSGGSNINQRCSGPLDGWIDAETPPAGQNDAETPLVRS